MKNFLACQRFSSNQETTAAVEEYFEDLTKIHYRDGIMALEHRWEKLLVLRKITLKNKNNFEIINSFLYCWAENFSDNRRRYLSSSNQTLMQHF
jgi:two-component sensor histidine kinase